MKKFIICAKWDKLDLKKYGFYIVAVLSLLLLNSNGLLSLPLQPVESYYSCLNTNIDRVKVTDENGDGIYDTYSVYWCDGTVVSYPICAVGDIRRWPPRGIPTRSISDNNIDTRAFIESYHGVNSSPLICQFIKYEHTDTVYYYDMFFDSKIISDVNDSRSENLKITVLPNPTKDEININYEVKSTSWINISLYNEIGIVVEELDNSYRHPGTYSLTKDLTHLQSGAYFMTIKIGYNEFITRKIIINK